MNSYRAISKIYDLLDSVHFSEKGKNPRDIIRKMIPNEKIKVLDLCLSNQFDVPHNYKGLSH